MANYKIICAVKERGHIAWVGTGSGNTYDRKWTVAQVRQAIRQGHVFFTVSPSTGKAALVEPHDTIRSKADAVKDNNLDNLPTCAA